ncbi:MAG: SAM-dependent methyltransferase, partial [Actinomycetota bacterium]|nr:SAM-dependent methyltransferase [Actinomycetota bacterium]
MTLEERIADRIRTSGPLTFAAFMQIALYDRTHGYYGSGEIRTGWHGQFVTSPELDPSFGELWGRAFEQMWAACDRPSTFEVVEVGGGEGAFAAAVLSASEGPFARALRYCLVERSERVSARQRELLASDDRVTWAPSLDEIEHTSVRCLFANEVLDNMPVHLIEGRPNGFVELFVGLQGDRLGLVEGPPRNNEVAAYLERHALQPEDGRRIEVGIAAEQMVRRLASLVDRGTTVLI